MKNRQIMGLVMISLCIFYTVSVFAQNQANVSPQLPVKYEELTAPDFVTAITQSASTCIIPIGILEKHGPHLPLGTDLLDVREIALRAARKEYTIVFPEYYFGQIFEARHQPGAIAYSVKLMWDVLQETCDELGRNGIRKIILVNGHGGIFTTAPGNHSTPHSNTTPAKVIYANRVLFEIFVYSVDEFFTCDTHMIRFYRSTQSTDLSIFFRNHIISTT